MNEATLTLKEIPQTGLEAEVISPNIFSGKSLDELRDLRIYAANKEVTLDTFFEVGGSTSKKPEDQRIVIEGDTSRVKRIGQEMSDGEILVKGDVGLHLGSRMKGGRIIVNGNAASWLGMEMSGGRIEVKGDAGNFVGSAYRGNWIGMEGGEIVIGGGAGSSVGACMAGGRITIKGDVGEFLGVRMRGGLIVVDGIIQPRLGAEMLAGFIIVNGEIRQMLPSFRKEETVEKINFPDLGFVIENKRFVEYVGDLAEDGKGKIYIKK